MSFAGLPLATLLPLTGAMAAALCVLYILKLRRRPIAVPFSHIWERILRDKEATHWFSQLKRLLSLLLQLAIVLLLLLALGDPRLGGVISEGRSVIVLIDGSASMKATDGTPTRIESAKAELRKMVAGLGGADRMLIAQMDASITPLSTMTGEIPDLEAAIDRLRASDTRADLPRALEFAKDSLRDVEKREVVVVSDGALGDLTRASLDLEGIELAYVPVGARKKNVAITGFSVRRYPLDRSRYEVMLEVTNTNDEPADVELTLLGDGSVVDVARLRLSPEERLPRFYPDLAGASRTLEATIKLTEGADDLPADDHAYALMPERRRSRVLVVTPGNTYLEAALLLDEYLDVKSVSPKDYPPAGAFDVTIFDGVAPAAAENSGGALYLNVPKTGGPVARKKPFEGFAFESWDKKHPVVRWMSLDDVQVAKGHTLDPEKGDHTIGASTLGPVLVAGRRGGRKFVALGFDPRDSDFVLRIAWPLFVLNTINHFVEEDTQYISSYRTGEVWRVPAPSGIETARLLDPLGQTHIVPIKEGRAVYLGEHAGFYELVFRAEANQADDGKIKFAANLVDPDESRIEPQATLEIGTRTAVELTGFSTGVRRELWLYLLLAVVIVSVLEWITYHRRVTV